MTLQANEFMRAPELPVPYRHMKSWSTGGETVSLDTILRMQEVGLLLHECPMSVKGHQHRSCPLRRCSLAFGP